MKTTQTVTEEIMKHLTATEIRLILAGLRVAEDLVEQGIDIASLRGEIEGQLARGDHGRIGESDAGLAPADFEGAVRRLGVRP